MPLAPKEIKGSINLRSRIVTVIDVRIRLGLEPRDSTDQSMGVTVEQDNDLYTLLVWSTRSATSLGCPGNFTKRTRERWTPCGGNLPTAFSASIKN